MTLQDRHIQLTLYDLAYDTSRQIRFPECCIKIINADRNHSGLTTYCEVADLDLISGDYEPIRLKQTIAFPLMRRKTNVPIRTKARRL